MKNTVAFKRLLLLVLLVGVGISGCSQPETAAPTDNLTDVINYLNTAQAIPVEAAQASAVNELVSDGLQTQGQVYTTTLSAVDLYNAPFVHITVTSP